MTQNRFAQLIKMAMARYGVRESDIRQALLELPRIDGNPANFFNHIESYAPQLKAVKEVFGSTLVLEPEEEAKLEQISDIRALFMSFFNVRFDNSGTAAFTSFSSNLFDSDQDAGFARASMEIKNIWRSHPEREGDLKLLISKLKKGFGFHLYDFPFTSFAKKFGAEEPSNYAVVPMWSALVDLETKLGGQMSMKIVSQSANVIRAELEMAIRDNRIGHDMPVSNVVKLCSRFYQIMVEDSHMGNKDGAKQLQMIITEIMGAVRLKYRDIPDIDKYPALAEFVKTGKLTGEVHKLTKKLLINAMKNVEGNLKAMLISKDYKSTMKATVGFVTSYDEILRKAKGNEQVMKYLFSLLKSAYTRSSNNKIYWIYVMYQLTSGYDWLQQDMTAQGLIRNPNGLRMIRKWGEYVDAKLGDTPQGALVRRALANMTALADEPNGDFAAILEAMLSIPTVGEKFARDYIRYLNRESYILLRWLKLGRVNPETAEQLEQFVLKVESEG